MKTHKNIIHDNNGFTLVELMIALAMSGIIVAAVYGAYIIQHKTYYTQGQVVDMQQNIRAVLEVMSGEIRMAGFDPTGTAKAKITTATVSQLAFTLDLNENGRVTPADSTNPNENITYGFGDSNGDGTSDDSDGDGVVDCDDDGDTVIDLVPFRRDTNGGGLQPIAENIQAIEFNYTLASGAQVTAPSPAQMKQIAAVQISILAIAGQRDAKYTNNLTYTTGSGNTWGPYADSFRRRLLVSTVNFRNQGL